MKQIAQITIGIFLCLTVLAIYNAQQNVDVSTHTVVLPFHITPTVVDEANCYCHTCRTTHDVVFTNPHHEGNLITVYKNSNKYHD